MTKNVLHLPAGTPVDIVVTSKDVIHAFWVPRLAGKIDAIPGRVNRLRIRADLPGRYEGTLQRILRSRPRQHALRGDRASSGGFFRRAHAGGRSGEGGKQVSDAGPSQGANCAPLGGSEAATAASVGVQ